MGREGGSGASGPKPHLEIPEVLHLAWLWVADKERGRDRAGPSHEVSKAEVSACSPCGYLRSNRILTGFYFELGQTRCQCKSSILREALPDTLLTGVPQKLTPLPLALSSEPAGQSWASCISLGLCLRSVLQWLPLNLSAFHPSQKRSSPPGCAGCSLWACGIC